MHKFAHKFTVALALSATPMFVACQSTATDHLTVDAPQAQLFVGMGSHTREITTSSPEAQEFFNQGLNWMYAFNHDEAIRAFARAAELDPESAMPWWGIALCEGPNYNDAEMTDERSAAAWGALQQARARISNTSALERELIEALTARYSKPWPEDRTSLEQAYADAMACIHESHPDDSDVGTLYAEAMMVQRPWKLYDAEGNPTGDTPRIVETLEYVMQVNPANPGANHLYIHAVEPSKTPEIGLEAADRLCNQVPGAGHLDHMPSHIYVQTGEWHRSIEQNAEAMRADARYRELSPNQGIQHMYMTHNAHMLAFSAMMVGREKEAMQAARSMWENLPSEMIPAVAQYIDLWMTSVYDVQKRFGRWNDILAEPAPPEVLPITTAVWRAHRAVAQAAKKNQAAAITEYELFLEAKDSIPEDMLFGDDGAHRILDVSDAFVAGEIALQREDWDLAIDWLERAVSIEDTLSYGEPPQWLQPTRHTLGAVHMKAGNYIEAERVYRADLDRWPGNGWSLFGLSRALGAQGKNSEAAKYKELYEAAWSQADEPITTSCKCLPNT